MKSDGVVKIEPLLTLADNLQSNRYPSETEWHLASKLCASLEAWQVALVKTPRLDAESIYFLSFDTFHFANALKLLSKTMPEGLDEIHGTMKKIMVEYSPSELEVKL